jgi:hypothetical protein
MTISTPGKIEFLQPRPTGLRDLSDKTVRDQIVAEARKDASATLLRTRRASLRSSRSS